LQQLNKQTIIAIRIKWCIH